MMMHQDNNFLSSTPPLTSLPQMPSNSFSSSPSPNTVLPRQPTPLSLKDLYIKECQKVGVKPNTTVVLLLEEAWDRAIQQQQQQQQQQQLTSAGLSSGQGVSNSFPNQQRGSITPVSGTLDVAKDNLSFSKEHQRHRQEAIDEEETSGIPIHTAATNTASGLMMQTQRGVDRDGSEPSIRAPFHHTETLNSGSSCELPPWAQQQGGGGNSSSMGDRDDVARAGSEGNTSGWGGGSPPYAQVHSASTGADAGNGEGLSGAGSAGGFHTLQNHQLKNAEEDEDLEAHFPWESADVQGTDLLAGTQRSLLAAETEVLCVDSPLQQGGGRRESETETDPRPPTAPAYRTSEVLGPVADDLDELCGIQRTSDGGIDGEGQREDGGNKPRETNEAGSGVQYIPTQKGPINSLNTSPGTSVGLAHDALFAQHANEILPPPTALSEKTNSNSEEETAAITPEVICEISLAHTMIGRRGFAPVLTVIEHSRQHLERLDLRGNELDNEAIEQLASLLATGFPRLKTVDLRHNRFTYRAAKHLAWMCEGVTHLAHMPPMAALPPSTSRSSVGQCYTMALNPLLTDFNRSPSTTRVESDGVSTVETSGFAGASGPGNDVLIAIRSNFRVGYDNVIEEVLLDGCLIPEPLLRCLQQRIADAIYRRDQRKKRLKSFMQMEYMLTVDPNASLNNSTQQMVLRINSAHNGFQGEQGGPGGFHNYSFTHGDVLNNYNNVNHNMNTTTNNNNLLDSYGIDDETSFHRIGGYAPSPHSASSHSLQRRGDPGSARRTTVDDPQGLPAIYMRFLQQMPQATEEDRRRQMDVGPLRTPHTSIKTGECTGAEGGGGEDSPKHGKAFSSKASSHDDREPNSPHSRVEDVESWQHDVNAAGGGIGLGDNSLSGPPLVMRPQTTAPNSERKPPLGMSASGAGNLHSYYASLESQHPQQRDRKTGSLRETPLFPKNTSSLRFNSNSAGDDSADGGETGGGQHRGRDGAGADPLQNGAPFSGVTSGTTYDDTTIMSPDSLATDEKVGFFSPYEGSESTHHTSSAGWDRPSPGEGGEDIMSLGSAKKRPGEEGGEDDEEGDDEEDLLSALQTESGNASQRHDDKSDSSPQERRRRLRPPRTARVATEGADEVYPPANFSVSSHEFQQQLSKSGTSRGGKGKAGKGKGSLLSSKDQQQRSILMESISNHNTSGFGASSGNEGIQSGAGKKTRHPMESAEEEASRVAAILQNEEMDSGVMMRSGTSGDPHGGQPSSRRGGGSGAKDFSSRDSSRMTRSIPLSTQETLPGNSPYGGLSKRDRERDFASEGNTANNSRVGSRSVSAAEVDGGGGGARHLMNSDGSPSSSLSISVNNKRGGGGSKRDNVGVPGPPSRGGGNSSVGSPVLHRRGSRSNSMLGKSNASSSRTGTGKTSSVGGGVKHYNTKSSAARKKQRHGSISAVEDETYRSGRKGQRGDDDNNDEDNDEDDENESDEGGDAYEGEEEGAAGRRRHTSGRFSSKEGRDSRRQRGDEEDLRQHRLSTSGRRQQGGGAAASSQEEMDYRNAASSSHSRSGGMMSGDELSKGGGSSLQDTLTTPLVASPPNETGGIIGGVGSGSTFHAGGLGIPNILSNFDGGNTSGRYGDGVSPVDTIHVSQSFGRQNTDEYEHIGGSHRGISSGSGGGAAGFTTGREGGSHSSRDGRISGGGRSASEHGSSQSGSVGHPRSHGAEDDGFHETESFAPRRVSPRHRGAELSSSTGLLQTSSRSFGDTRQSQHGSHPSHIHTALHNGEENEDQHDWSSSNPPPERCPTSPGNPPNPNAPGGFLHSEEHGGNDREKRPKRVGDDAAGALHSVEEDNGGGVSQDGAGPHDPERRPTGSSGGGRTASRSGQRRPAGEDPSAREGHRMLHGSEEGMLYHSIRGDGHGTDEDDDREVDLSAEEVHDPNTALTHEARRRRTAAGSNSHTNSNRNDEEEGNNNSGTHSSHSSSGKEKDGEEFPPSLQLIPPPLVPSGGPFSSGHSGSRFSPPSSGPLVRGGADHHTEEPPEGRPIREGKSSSVTDVWGSSPVSGRNQLYSPSTSCSSYQSGRLSPFSGRKSASPHARSNAMRSSQANHKGVSQTGNDSSERKPSPYVGPFSSQNVSNVAMRSSARSLSQEDNNNTSTGKLPSDDLVNSTSREERMALLRLRSSGRVARSTGEVSEEKSKPSFQMVSDCWGSFM